LRARRSSKYGSRPESGTRFGCRLGFGATTLVGEQRYVYGPDDLRPIDFPRQALHSYRLAFRHPVTGQQLSFEAPLPGDMAEIDRPPSNPNRPVGRLTNCQEVYGQENWWGSADLPALRRPERQVIGRSESLPVIYLRCDDCGRTSISPSKRVQCRAAPRRPVTKFAAHTRSCKLNFGVLPAITPQRVLANDLAPSNRNGTVSRIPRPRSVGSHRTQRLKWSELSASTFTPAAVAFVDGLWRTPITSSDPSGSETLEVLCVRDELAAVPSFEFALRERVSRLATFRHSSCVRCAPSSA
jgi:hypothetical protein